MQKQLLYLTTGFGWKVVSTRHPQPWQKNWGRSNGFQGETNGGCPINWFLESHKKLAMLCIRLFRLSGSGLLLHVINGDDHIYCHITYPHVKYNKIPISYILYLMWINLHRCISRSVAPSQDQLVRCHVWMKSV